MGLPQLHFDHFPTYCSPYLPSNNNMAPPSGYVVDRLLPLEPVKLGRLVTNKAHPHQRYHPLEFPGWPELPSHDVIHVGEQEASSRSNMKAIFASILSANFLSRDDELVTVDKPTYKRYMLEQSDDWFAQATAQPETQKWIEKTVQSCEKSHLIVGYYTVLDQNITRSRITARAQEYQAKLPVAEALAASGLPMPVAGALPEVQAGAQLSDSGTEATQTRTLGEKVFAIEYRTVAPFWRAKTDVARMTLDEMKVWDCTTENEATNSERSRSWG